jgi:hypothetical protein
MDKVSIILSSLIMITLVIIMAPSIVALNRGKVLRNVAIWLAIFLVLMLVYRNFGPGKDRPQGDAVNQTEQDGGATSKDEDNGDQGYMPPKE